MNDTQGLLALGVPSSVGSLNFVPSGFSGAGNLVVASYNSSTLHTLPYSEVDGIYVFGNVTNSVSITGGPEGITHVPQGSELFPNPSMLVSAYSAGSIVAYETDANGLPIPATARPFVTGLSGAEGATVDPVTGDFLFSTFGGGNQVVLVTGFIPEPSTYAFLFGLLCVGLLGARRHLRLRQS